MSYPLLFSKGRIGKCEIKNRIVMPAIGTSLASAAGEASPEIIRYYEERAQGGAGLIITEITRVNDEHGVGTSNQLCATGQQHIPGLERLARAVHKYDTKIFAQLHHPGRESHSHLIGGRQIVAPSPIMCNACKEMPRELTTDEVASLVKDFVKGAKIVQTAGLDGVELHGAHGYLIGQFLSPYTNKREDKYGGSFEKRMQFITEIIMGIKHICGKNFPVCVRIDGDEFVEGGVKIEEAVKIAVYLESIGIDAINISSGTYESMTTIIEPISYPQGWKKHLAGAVKKAVKIPVIAVDVIRTPEFAESLLEQNNQDFIGLGRPLLADPQWGEKARTGREKEIRPCVSCLHCIEEIMNGRQVSCAVNARLGRELEFTKADSAEGRSAVVIGGGPGGMESANVLAERGFKTVLFEKENDLGGMLLFGNKPPKKDKLDWLTEYQVSELKRAGVDVRTGKAPSIDDVAECKPDFVVVAAGASPLIPPIDGVNGGNVSSVIDVLGAKVSLKDKTVAVIGSGMTGCETAELLGEQGNKVMIVDMLSSIGEGSYLPNLIDVLMRLKKQGTELLPGYKLSKITKDSIELVNVKTGETVIKAVDHVVLSMGVKPNNEMVEALEKKFRSVRVIGDAGRPGRIGDAVRQGFEAAWVS